LLLFGIYSLLAVAGGGLLLIAPIVGFGAGALSIAAGVLGVKRAIDPAQPFRVHLVHRLSPMAQIVMLLSNPYRPDPRVRKEAVALHKNGHAVQLYAWDREVRYPTEETKEGIEVRRIHLASSYDSFFEVLVNLPRVWGQMIWQLRSQPLDVIHAHDLDTLPVGLFIAKLRRKPCVFDAHEVYSAMIQRSVPGWVARFIRWLEGRLVPAAQVVLTVNDTLGEIYEGLGARRVVVVMNAPHRAEIEGADPAPVRRKLGLEGARVVLYAGMLEPSRNLDTLLRVFEGWTEAAPVLVVGGHGSLVEQIKERTRRAPGVQFIGWIPSEEMASHVAASDAVLLLDDPAYPIARVATATRLFFSMALGVPMIASEGTGTAAVVLAEDLGAVVPHDDVGAIRRALVALLDDAPRRATIAQRAPQVFTARYSWEIMQARLVDTYRTLLG
ncbi:MAG: glycosyltransferase family 4 protein, partial [Candidatus Methylomirabilales bacterium]